MQYVLLFKASLVFHLRFFNLGHHDLQLYPFKILDSHPFDGAMMSFRSSLCPFLTTYTYVFYFSIKTIPFQYSFISVYCLTFFYRFTIQRLYISRRFYFFFVWDKNLSCLLISLECSFVYRELRLSTSWSDYSLYFNFDVTLQ